LLGRVCAEKSIYFERTIEKSRLQEYFLRDTASQPLNDVRIELSKCLLLNNSNAVGDLFV